MPTNEHPEPDPIPQLDGVGITPQPEPDPADLSATADIQEPQSTIDVDSGDRDINRLFVRAYSLVAAALLLSAIVATQAKPPSEDSFLTREATLQFLFVFEVVCVALLSRFVARLPRNLAALVLFVVAAINGASFTVFLIWIPAAALAYGFFTCALAFAATAAIAEWKKIDLSAPRGFFTLFGVGIVLIAGVTLVFRLNVYDWAAASTGFVAFAALASYYCDDIRDLDLEFEDDSSEWKSAVIGALILYLNFINIYVLTMRLVAGDSRNEKRKRGLWL